jgi:cytoskeletal protein CcmA (bactofilin family)
MLRNYINKPQSSTLDNEHNSATEADVAPERMPLLSSQTLAEVLPERMPVLASQPLPTISRPLAATSTQLPSSVNSYSNINNTKNILASDVEIIGTIKFTNELVVDGKIDGHVISDGLLTVGENASIKGEVKTRSVIIFGKVEGNINVQDRCELKSNASLIGDITAGTLSIEEGATFMGQSSVGRKS